MGLRSNNSWRFRRLVRLPDDHSSRHSATAVFMSHGLFPHMSDAKRP